MLALDANRSSLPVSFVDVGATGDHGERRAFVVGVSAFGEGLAELDVQPVADLKELLAKCNWTVESEANTTANELRGHLAEARIGHYEVVHILTHGVFHERSGHLWLAGAHARSDSITSESWVDARSWLSEAVHAPPHTPALIIFLDTCYAGDAAQLDWLDEGSRTVYVFAATEPGQWAFKSRFTKAVTALLSRLADRDDFGAHPSTEYISLGLVRNALAFELARICRQESHASPQHLLTSRHELRHDHTHSLFPNPNYHGSKNLRWSELAQHEPALADSVDPVLGGRHFLTRALGTTPDRDSALCHFEGREEELEQLVEWIDENSNSSFRIVTGSPGMGKSAVVGMLVCLMHPLLTQFSHRLENRLRGSLKPRRQKVGQMAAVHARNRDVYELTQSIGRQIAPQEAIAGVDHLIRFVKSMPESPLIVVDALDESIEPTAVMSELLLRIIDERNASGGPICRMLVGTRDEERFSHLFGSASPHAIIDLDKTDFGRLETDISSYIQDLIREQDPHLDRAMVRAFAAATAEKVTPKERPGSGSRIEIGPFLLAQIHTFRMIDGPLLQIGDVDVAKSLGSAAPVTVEEAFLSEFEEESEPWLKPLLTAFALSFGNGMPLLHARSIAVNITAGELPWRSDRELRELAFGRARFYLRTDIDIDGSTLYGLFHQSLQEYLLRELDARTSEAYASTFAALRDDLGYGPASGPDWENRATPYLRRYFGSYARRAGELDSVVSDIHFLIHAEHNHVMDSLRSLQTIQARRTAAAYRISHSYHRIADSDSRLFRLALDAARINEAKLLTDIRNLSATSTAILPRWSTGTIAAYVPTTDVREIDFEATVIRVTRFEGRKVCVIGCYDGEIQVRDLKSGDLLQRFYTNRWPLRDVTCAETEGDVLAISVSQGMAYVWSLTSGSLVRVIGTPADRLSVVATIRWGCRDLLVTGAVEGKLKVWDLARGSQLHTLTGKRGVSRSMACFVLNGRPVAAAATDSGRTHVWDLLTGELLRSFEVVAEYVTCIHLSGKPMLITANAAGAVRTLDLNTSHCEEQFALRRGVPIKLASSVLDGNPVLVVHGPRDSGWVGIWDLADRRFVRELRSYLTNATAVVVEEVAGRTLAVTASADRHLYWCDLSVKPSIDEVLVPMSPIKAIAVTEIGPHTVAVSGGIDGSIEVWNLSSRERTLPTINSSQGIGVTDIACVNMNGQVVAAVLLEDGSLGTLLIHPDISPITQHLPAQGQYSLDREQHLALDGASTKPSFVVARKTRLHIVNFQGDDSWVFDLAALDAPAQPRVGSIDIHEGIYRILSLDVYSTPAQSWAVVCSSSVRSSSIDWLQREVRVYDLREKLLIRKFNAPGLKRLIVADIDDTKVVAGVGDACRISVWDIATGRRLRTIGPEKEWTSITYGIIGQQHVALVGAADGELSIWDIVSGRELFTQIFPAAINRVTVAIQAVVVSFGDDLAVVDVPGLGTRA